MNDVICTAFSYAWQSKATEEITGFSMKDCLSISKLGSKELNSLSTEKDEPIYTYNDMYMRHLVGDCIRSGRVGSFNQYYESKMCDKVFKIISEKLNVKGNLYNPVEAYLEYKNKRLKIYKKEYESKSIDYKNGNVDEKEKYINGKLSQPTLHQLLKQIKLDEKLWGVDAASLYPSARWDENSIYPRIETGYAFTKVMNNKLVKTFNNGNFNQGSAIFKIKYYNAKNLIVQHIPVKEKVKKIENDCMRNGYIIDNLTSVDIQEIVKNGCKVIEFYEGVVYRENFKIGPFRNSR